DIRDIIFKEISEERFKAIISTEKDGCLSGVAEAKKIAAEIDVEINFFRNEGESIEAGEQICEIIGTPKQITIAEEKIIGNLCKYSGISTAARKAVELSNGRSRIVSGSIKKMPPEIKMGVRRAIESGGASCRISTTPMVYLDKNYIKMLGSIPKALKSVESLTELVKVIQIKGQQFSIEEETKQAIENGCNILMVDTGNLQDLEKCIDITERLKKRNDVQIAFSGGVKLEQIEMICKYNIDAVCIGKDIVDALLLDMKLDVLI
ncbi:MAG: quinolinate phosphoribosyl transferase, partial [Sedimentibacter sp.]